MCEVTEMREEDIRALDRAVMDILLKDRTTGKNIIWATDDYRFWGDGFQAEDEITIMHITGQYSKFIKPRISKAQESQYITDGLENSICRDSIADWLQIGYNVFGGGNMIKSISFENFRGLKGLELPELSQITLLTGKNNAGKSSILEGVFLLMDHALAESFVRINNYRGIYVRMEPSSLWAPAFYGLNTDISIRIQAKIDDELCSIIYSKDNNFIATDNTSVIQNTVNQFAITGKSNYTLKYHFKRSNYTEDGNFSTNGTGLFRNITTSLPNNQIRPMPDVAYINSVTLFNGVENLVSDWLGKMELNGKKDKIVKALRYIEKDMSNLITITNQGQVQVYAKIADQTLPVRLSGDGLYRLLYILLTIMANPDSIILIDEIETGFHYTMYETLWQLVAEAVVENNCQIIATTHSYECIENAISGINKAGFETRFCMYRIEHSNGENRAIRYDEELARLSIDMNLEVR